MGSKPITFYIFLVLTTFLFLSCNSKSTNSTEECEATKWDTVQEPIVSYYMKITADLECTADGKHPISEAENLHITGSITKIYCSGEVSSEFPYNSYYYPSSDVFPYYFKVGQAYQFKFENDKDYLFVLIRIKANFSDGTMYESTDMTFNIYYSTLLLNINTGGRYFIQIINSGDLEWAQVTS